MPTSPTANPVLVIDANIAIAALLPVPFPADAPALLRTWQRGNTIIAAPSLWLAETTSVIRRYAFTKQITNREGEAAVEDLATLDVRIFPADLVICQQAYRWAARFGQARAYDGFYLALAESMNAPFITADRRLVNRGKQFGLTWLTWVGDLATT